MITALLCTVNKPDFLELLLRSIRENSKYDVEVFVWGNGSLPDTKQVCDKHEARYFHSSENVGISAPMCKMINHVTQDRVIVLDDDMYMLPGWDLICDEISEPGDWRSPIQIDRLNRNRGITRYYGNNPQDFQENSLLQDFKDYTYPIRTFTTFLPGGMLTEDFKKIGGYSLEHNFFLGEAYFLYKTYLYIANLGKKMVCHPRAYFYHFRSKTPRPPFLVGEEGKKEYDRMMRITSMETGVPIKDLESMLPHNQVAGPTFGKSGEMIEY
jgi:glycosyltransferase involved in cell wall biosynthesis